MKRLSKVLFALAVILLIALPLSAAKSMNVTWSWLLNDPYVTSYRYQLDGESEDGWTVVDGTTSSYQATGLDPYKDYTLYLQCTYDGKIWSDSATSTAYALLQVEEIVEDLPVVEEVAPVEAETASFTLFGYTVENSWLDGVFTSTLKEKGIVTEDDVRGFALSEVEKYGEMLTSSATISFISDGFTLTYPETIDPADYIDVYKADLDAYITSLFASEEAPEVEEAPVEEAVEETEEEMDIETSDFDVFGYRILNSWYEGVFVSQTEEFGLVSEDDVIGFAEYEAEKYGELLTSNCYVYIVPDGFILLYPETLDIAPYIGIYKSDLEEYISSLFAAAEEPVVEETIEESPVVEEVAPVEAETASFTLFGYTVENSWLDGVFTSTLKEKGIVTEDDVRGFALSEVEKYGEMLTANTAISFVADGFTLTYPETVDPADYIDVYKADLDAYITSLFTSEEAPVEETEIVVEEAEVPPAPEKAEAIDVPEPISDVEVKLSPKAEKVSSFSFRLGIDGGVEMGINEVDPYSTIFPRLNISLDFRNILSFGKLGFGTRFDIGSVFKPLDGTFIGHDFNYFLNGNNWAMDATVDAKLMAYLNLGKFDFYLGGGIGYSIGSHNLYNRTHSGENTVFGFDTALVATGVVGLEWNITDSFSLALEGYYRNFFQSEAKAQSFAASLVMGFRF